MLHLFNTPIYNPFEVFPNEKITEWTNAGKDGKVKYEKAVIANFEAIANDGWEQSKNFRLKYSQIDRGGLKNSKMSMNNGYKLYLGLNKKNVKFNSKDGEQLKQMVSSFPFLNFEANKNLETKVATKIRERYSKECFDFAVKQMNKLVEKMEAASTMLDFFATPRHTHYNHTGHATPAYGHGHSDQQKGTPEHTRPPETHHDHTGLQTTRAYGYEHGLSKKLKGMPRNTGIAGTNVHGHDSTPCMTFSPTNGKGTPGMTLAHTADP